MFCWSKKLNLQYPDSLINETKPTTLKKLKNVSFSKERNFISVAVSVERILRYEKVRKRSEIVGCQGCELTLSFSTINWDQFERFWTLAVAIKPEMTFVEAKENYCRDVNHVSFCLSFMVVCLDNVLRLFLSN